MPPKSRLVIQSDVSLEQLLAQSKPVSITVGVGMGAAASAAVPGTPDEDIATFSILETPPNPATFEAEYKYGMLPLWWPLMKSKKKWRFTPLYKNSAHGSNIIWWVGFDFATNELLMTHGYVGGAIRTDRTKVEENKSGRSIHEQSVLEARQRYLIKYRNEGYRPPGAPPATSSKPMLAAKWEPEKTRLRFPVYVQPKLDGMRCLVHREGAGIVYRSRGNVKWPHLNAQFDPEIAAFLSFIPVEAELDGEMYLPVRFTELTKVMKNMVNLHPLLPSLMYYIYDFNTSEALPYERRIEILLDAKKKYLEAGYENKRFDILFTATCNNKDEIKAYHSKFRGLGYEGTIIRKISNWTPFESADFKASLYKSGRSNNMLKYKDYQDSEGLVVGIQEAKGTHEGAAILVVRVTHPDAKGTMITTDVPMSAKYSIEERREWLKNPSLVIGERVTYKYLEISQYGIPREPLVITLRSVGIEGEL